jgi:hypothetical protein
MNVVDLVEVEVEGLFVVASVEGEGEVEGLFVVASVEEEGEVRYFYFCQQRDKPY